MAALEDSLRLALCNFDVEALDKLLLPNFLFASHLVQMISKAGDRHCQKTKYLSLTTLPYFIRRVDLGNALVH